MPFDRSCSSGTVICREELPGIAAISPLSKEDEGKRVRVIFDGIYKNAKIWCNSYYLGCYPYGYSEIALDITDLWPLARRKMYSVSEWSGKIWRILAGFTGCGIYRKVSIETSEPVGFAHHGVFFSVDSVADGCANITVQSEVENHTGEDAETTLCHRLLTQDGEEAAVLEKAVTVAAGEKTVVTLTGQVKNPQLWEPSSPVLYQLISTVGNDQVENPVGIREVTFDADHGFFCNGNP